MKKRLKQRHFKSGREKYGETRRRKRDTCKHPMIRRSGNICGLAEESGDNGYEQTHYDYLFSRRYENGPGGKGNESKNSLDDFGADPGKKNQSRIRREQDSLT